MNFYRGLTWEHDRGKRPLEAASRLTKEQSGDIRIAWNTHPLEGFESAPIAQLLREHDVIVLDHPHLGDAIETRMLTPIDEIFDDWSLRQLEQSFVGPSLRSYQIEGKTWALPLDAATQVAARRPDLHNEAVVTWTDVIALSKTKSVALSLSGPHAFLSFLSAYKGMEGRSDFTRAAFISDLDEAGTVLQLFQEIYANRKTEYSGLNPISLLELMSDDSGVAYLPLVYGYVNYSTDSQAHPVLFEDVPLFDGHSVRGSIVGGTGLGVSKRARITDAFVEHLKWLISPEAQNRFIPQHQGQPARLSAWQNDEVNVLSRGFYRNTLRTMSDAAVRPRFPGYTEFQAKASQIVRNAVISAEDPAVTIEALEELAGEFTMLMSVKYA